MSKINSVLLSHFNCIQSNTYSTRRVIYAVAGTIKPFALSYFTKDHLFATASDFVLSVTVCKLTK